MNPTSSGASYRKEVFEQTGMYDETLDACEDVDFNYRVWRKGLRSYISPNLTVYYHARKSVSGLWKQMMRYGRGRYRFIRRHPDAISIAQLLPSALVLWLAFGTIGSFWLPMLRIALLVTVSLYGAAVVASSAWLAFSRFVSGAHHLSGDPPWFGGGHVGGVQRYCKTVAVVCAAADDAAKG